MLYTPHRGVGEVVISMFECLFSRSHVVIWPATQGEILNVCAAGVFLSSMCLLSFTLKAIAIGGSVYSRVVKGRSSTGCGGAVKAEESG